MQYKIASFNMYKFNAYKSSEEIKKDLSMIAKIINEEKFDVVAMQEVLNEKALEMLVLHLTGKWDWCWNTPNSKYGSSISREGYGYIWRSDKLKLVETTLASGEIRINKPEIWNHHQKGTSLQLQKLVRNPYYIRLMPKSGRYEIRLINAHIMFSKNAVHANNPDLVDASDIKMRNMEYQTLIRSIYPSIASKRYGDNMPAYTILLGDYNLNLHGGDNKAPYLDLSNKINLIDKVISRKNGNVEYQSYEIVTTQYEKTSLSNKEPVFVNNYDHFSYDKSINDYCKNPRRVNTVYKYYEKGDKNLSPKEAYAEHKKQVSDHVPIVMDFSIKLKNI